jgi:pyrroline-5-carboxylate reductase
MIANKKIGIIGCGNMGEAILERLALVLEKSTSIMVSEMDAKRRDYIQSKYRIIVEIDNNQVVKFADVIILAVKPKDLRSLIKDELCCSLDKSKLVISIAAGVTTKFIEDIVGEEMPVIRMMPNMPAMIGEGISSLSRGRYVNNQHAQLAKEIFTLIGSVVEVDEKLVDAVTAVSGSGPAYYFYFIEAMIEAAKELGLDDEKARELVLKTMFGTAKLLEFTKQDPIELRARVASKGGTTEAAINSFESRDLKGIVAAALEAARDRSIEISRG